MTIKCLNHFDPIEEANSLKKCIVCCAAGRTFWTHGAYSDSANIPFVVYLHADQEENAGKKYNEQGDEIIIW